MLHSLRIGIILIISFITAQTALAQYSPRIDSLMTEAARLRDLQLYDNAVAIYLTLPTEAAQYELAATYYTMGKTTLALSLCREIEEQQGLMADKASLLMARCRDDQGYDAAAKRIYKRLIDKQNPDAAYYYALMLYRGGHVAETTELLMKALRWDNSLADAHLLLSEIMTNQGERFKAMMPLYYFLLIASDETQRLRAYDRLIALWRHSAKAIDILHINRPSHDAFNDRTDKMIEQWATTDSISVVDGSEQIERLLIQTNRLFRYLLDTSETNLDFWQLTYTDFFVTLVPRNFVAPYVYFISDVRHHAAVLDWIGREEALFAEFMLWMSAQ